LYKKNKKKRKKEFFEQKIDCRMKEKKIENYKNEATRKRRIKKKIKKEGRKKN
jgi:hypothetical protein